MVLEQFGKVMQNVVSYSSERGWVVKERQKKVGVGRVTTTEGNKARIKDEIRGRQKKDFLADLIIL